MRMNLNVKKSFLMATLGVALVFTVAAKSEAAFIAYVCNDALCAGGDDIFVQDNNVTSQNGGVDSVGVLGFINLTVVNFNGYSVTVNQSQSKPFLANGMDLNYSVSTGTGVGGGDIWLFAADTSFAGPTSLSGTLGGTSDNGSVTASICGGDSNDQFNSAPCVSGTDNTVPAINIALGPLSATANPYSLLLGVRVNLTGPGTTATGDFRVNSSGKIPEPASMLLFGFGLVGLGFWGRKRLGK